MDRLVSAKHSTPMSAFTYNIKTFFYLLGLKLIATFGIARLFFTCGILKYTFCNLVNHCNGLRSSYLNKKPRDSEQVSELTSNSNRKIKTNLNVFLRCQVTALSTVSIFCKCHISPIITPSSSSSMIKISLQLMTIFNHKRYMTCSLVIQKHPSII